MGIHWGSCCSSWTKLIRTPTRRTLVWKTVRKKHWWNLVGKKHQIVNACSFTDDKIFFSVYVYDIKMAGKKPNLALVWKKLMEDVDFEEPTSFLDHVYLGCTQRRCKPNEKINRPYNKMFESRFFCCSNREITRTEQISRKHFSVVLRRGRTCSKMRGTVLRIGKQDGPTIQSFSSLFGRSSNQKKKNRKIKVNCRKFALQTVFKCLYLARIGPPDILWSVNKLARSVTKWTQACDRRLARLIHEWLPPMLSCGQCGSTLSTAVISRFRLCRRSWRLKINIRRIFVHFWKSNICTNQLDVQEANVSVAQLYWVRTHIVGCWFAFGRFTCAWLVEFGHWSAGNGPKNIQTNPSMHTRNQC